MAEIKLHHVWCEPIETFFQRIDECGGWPVGNKYVSFYHSTDRECTFGNINLRTGWWTTIATADEYYFWKLSDEYRAKIREEQKQVLIRQLSKGA